VVWAPPWRGPAWLRGGGRGGRARQGGPGLSGRAAFRAALTLLFPNPNHVLAQAEFEKARDYKPEAKDWLSSYWAGFNSPNQTARIRNTGVPMNFLKEARRAPAARREQCRPPQAAAAAPQSRHVRRGARHARARRERAWRRV